MDLNHKTIHYRSLRPPICARGIARASGDNQHCLRTRRQTRGRNRDIARHDGCRARRQESTGKRQEFLEYVDDKYYDGTIFHRVMKDFMIQGGGFTINMTASQPVTPFKTKPRTASRISVEPWPWRAPQTLTAPPASSSSITATTPFSITQDRMGWGYAVFGKLISGKDVLDKIAVVKTGSGDVPGKPVVITSIRRVEPEK